MRILLCHNYYQHRGGEDESFEAEALLLESHGHQVVRYTVHNDDIHKMSRWSLLRKTIWNRDSYEQVTALIKRHRPDVMHCTNTFPLISPAVYHAARRANVAVVQSLRNYRLLCPSAFLFRGDSPCESCLGKHVAWPAVVHACYRNSRTATALVVLQNGLHQLLGTWMNCVDHYFTPTEFTRSKFIEAGFPPARIAVKPNFVFPDPGPCEKRGDYAVYVGRLTFEKGVDTLLEAWKILPAEIPLKVIGEGPRGELVEQAAEDDGRITMLGQLSREKVLDVIGQAKLLIMPSIWYETFGRTMVEAFSRGTPVLASRLGAMNEIITDGRTGLLFSPGDAGDLAAKATALLNDSSRLEQMRDATRRDYENRFSADGNYEILTGIYREAIAARNAGS